MFLNKTLTALCIFVISASSSATTLTLDMRNRVVVSESNVTLADIVKQMHGNKQLINKLSTLIVMNVGDTNQFRKLNRDKLSHEISKYTDNLSIKFSGAENTYVRVKTQTYNIENIINEITNKISAELEDVSTEFSVKYVGDTREISIPSGTVTYKYQLPDSVIKKRIPVWMDLYVNSKHYQSIPLWFNASIMADVVVANTRISAGEQLTNNIASFSRKDISLYKNRHIKTHDLNNLRIKRDVRAGEVLTEGSIEQLPPVFKGQTVKVISKHNNVTIQVSGFALDDGKLGETVRIKRTGSNRVFTAVVNNPGQVTAIGL